ncbi:MAG TPA: helix-turn-helix transcriptional regulator [Solirubrobacterales bacterium]|nr:helix-turn-helix transcriptional regulator [Solirubrobacterales bacterium]
MAESQEAENVALGRVLRQLRKEAGLSQDGLAERSQIPVTTLQRIEAGAVEADWGTLRHLAHGLGTSLAEVFRLVESDSA